MASSCENKVVIMPAFLTVGKIRFRLAALMMNGALRRNNSPVRSEFVCTASSVLTMYPVGAKSKEKATRFCWLIITHPFVLIFYSLRENLGSTFVIVVIVF